MENRQRLINIIEDMYPADAMYTVTAEIGQKLLLEALYASWRNLPDEVLQKYAELCQLEESCGFIKKKL